MIFSVCMCVRIHSDQSKPQTCPIQPPFLLTNIIKDGSTCQQSISSSYLNQCADDRQFHLHLAPCSSHHAVLGLTETSSLHHLTYLPVSRSSFHVRGNLDRELPHVFRYAPHPFQAAIAQQQSIRLFRKSTAGKLDHLVTVLCSDT